jgi:hypothetical protein
MSVDPDGQARRTQAVTLGVFTARVRERYAMQRAQQRTTKDDFVPAEFHVRREIFLRALRLA